MHLINFASDNPITIEPSGNYYSATLADMSNLNGVTKGQAVFAFHYGPTGKRSAIWTKQFVMNNETLVDTLKAQFSDGICKVDLPEPNPCTGFVSSNMEGFIVAPAILLRFHDRRDIVIMSLTPHKDKLKIALQKTVLSISGGSVQAQVFLSVADGVECSGTISGTGFKKAELVLTRRPDSQMVKEQFYQTLAVMSGPGPFASSWIPVSRAFEDVLAVFRPAEIQDYNMERILGLLGANDDAFRGHQNSSFIIGDGRGTNYALSLVIDRSLRRDMTDETVVTIS